jgi:undecaprenyl-diphosphatase
MAVPVAARGALLTGHWRLAARMALAGVTTWTLSKLIKRVYRRPRPPALVEGVRSRGPEPSGLGYVSGHAGIAVALGVAAWSELPPRRRLPILLVVPVVGLCRIYVGAHLPLDVAGGAALGLGADAIFAWLLDAERAPHLSAGQPCSCRHATGAIHLAPGLHLGRAGHPGADPWIATR